MQISHVVVYRVVIVVGTACIYLSGIYLDDQSLTFVLPGLELPVLAMGSFVVIGSFCSVWVREHLGECFMVTNLVTFCMMAVSLYESSLATELAIGSFVAILLSSIVWHTQKLVVVGVSLTTAIFLVAGITVPEPMMSSILYAIYLLLVALYAIVLSTMLIRLRVEKEFKQAMTEAIFEESNDALVYAHARTRKIFDANQRAEGLFETANWQELSDLLNFGFIQALGGDASPKAINAALEDPNWERVVQFKTQSGGKFWGSYTASRLRLNRDVVIARITDISEMQAQKEALVEARDAAESAMEARTQFLAHMSHEIRTPMNGVIGMTSLLLNTRLDDEQHSYVETVRSSGESLLTIINEILDFTKIEANQIELELHPFNLEECLAGALDVVSTLAAKKSVELILDFNAQDRCIVMGDSQRLRQVLVNLLSNAVKFTEQGEVVLKVRVEESEREEGLASIFFSVIDSGIGIDANKLDILFEPFVQADSSTTRRFGGTGLGLSICKSLVQHMGGEMSVTSDLDRGSTFNFHVRANCEYEASDLDFAKLAGKLVLGVDDNQTNRLVLEGLLKWVGVEVKLFDSPQALLEAFPHSHADLIISDMAMPDMNGAELLDELIDKYEQVPPVILLTSLDRGDVDWGKFRTVLRKPVRPSDLFLSMLRALSTHSENKTPQKQFAPDLSPLAGESVLVAEDNLVNQTVARKMLSQLGLHADIASNGAEAIQMLSRQHYRIVFMDVQMPEVDGLEATQIIRGDASLPQPHIIAMTANVMSTDRANCIDVGMDDFVPKPVRMEDIQKALQRAAQAGVTPH